MRMKQWARSDTDADVWRMCLAFSAHLVARPTVPPRWPSMSGNLGGSLQSDPEYQGNPQSILSEDRSRTDGGY